MNIEIMRNTLYKAYIEDFYRFCQSRHAHVSVDSMLEALQRSAPVQQQEMLEEEDEALIKSIFQLIQGLREFVRRIDDDELDDDDDNITKRRKVSSEVSEKPTYYLTKTNTVDKSNKKVSYLPNGVYAEEKASKIDTR